MTWRTSTTSSTLISATRSPGSTFATSTDNLPNSTLLHSFVGNELHHIDDLFQDLAHSHMVIRTTIRAEDCSSERFWTTATWLVHCALLHAVSTSKMFLNLRHENFDDLHDDALEKGFLWTHLDHFNDLTNELENNLLRCALQHALMEDDLDIFDGLSLNLRYGNVDDWHDNALDKRFLWKDLDRLNDFVHELRKGHLHDLLHCEQLHALGKEDLRGVQAVSEQEPRRCARRCALRKTFLWNDLNDFHDFSMIWRKDTRTISSTVRWCTGSKPIPWNWRCRL